MKTLLLILLCVSQPVLSAYLVKQTIDNGKTNIESVKLIDKSISSRQVLKSIRESIAEKDVTKEVIYQEILIPNDQTTDNLKSLALNKMFTPSWAGAEVRQIINTGKDSNRITITILGDGYTESEKEKYFDDVNRMVTDMFKEITFKSYLPVFNIYAIFTPSEESGISDLRSKRTAFDLYRSPRGSKRGIMPGDKPAIEKALNLIDANTDYPIIIANDDYYGGLGGRYAITTRSLTSGSMVLRHELGHNFSNVGEEYDGGQVYSGANFSSSINVPWKHWVNTSDGKVHVHKAKFLTGSYVWQDLGTSDFGINFKFPRGGNFTYDMKISSVGWETKGDVKVLLDGKELELNGTFTKDRSFFRTKKVAITSGDHDIKIIDNNRDGNNVLAYANGYAYPSDYDFTPGKVGAFNVFADGGKERGYRPTHGQCLMRDMRQKTFCSIDQENIWIRFLGRISLIDSVKKIDGLYQVQTLNLKGLSYKWFKKINRREIKELPALAGLSKVDLNQFGKGKYQLQVTYKTSEIRKKTTVTKDTREIVIK